MDDYITKPVRHTDLSEALLRWIPTADDASTDALDQGEAAEPQSNSVLSQAAS
jgi:FixJ family two-component response regulator